MHTDPISDYLTRIRNAQMAGHKVVDIPASNMKKKLPKFYMTKDIYSITNLRMILTSKEI